MYDKYLIKRKWIFDVKFKFLNRFWGLRQTLEG